MTRDLQEEVDARIEICKDDPQFQEDNPNMSERDYQFDALNCIRAMGDDYGGNFEGIEKDPEARKWRKMRREAIKLLETEYAAEYQIFVDSMDELNRQFPTN